MKQENEQLRNTILTQEENHRYSTMFFKKRINELYKELEETKKEAKRTHEKNQQLRTRVKQLKTTMEQTIGELAGTLEDY